VKQLFQNDSCLRVGLYGHFHESVSPQQPEHLCCSACREKCTCKDDSTCSADELPYKSSPSQITQPIAGQESSSQPRILNKIDKEDLRLSLTELKEQYSCGMMSIFHEETSHGFCNKLINEILEHTENIFTSSYLTDKLAIYSSRHAIDILEIFQELFGDIEHFEDEMDELYLINKAVSDSESYLLANCQYQSDAGEASTSTADSSVIPEFDIDF
jgi:hypothetical protein